MQASDAIEQGRANLALCVGTESMSRNPVASYSTRTGFAAGAICLYPTLVGQHSRRTGLRRFPGWNYTNRDGRSRYRRIAGGRLASESRQTCERREFGVNGTVRNSRYEVGGKKIRLCAFYGWLGPSRTIVRVLRIVQSLSLIHI